MPVGITIDREMLAAFCRRWKIRELALSLVKCIEIIGEAASKVSQEARSAHHRNKKKP